MNFVHFLKDLWTFAWQVVLILAVACGLGVILGYSLRFLNEKLLDQSKTIRAWKEYWHEIQHEMNLSASEEKNIFLSGAANRARTERLIRKHEKKASELKKKL